MAEGSIPVPVLELDARWFAPWANLIAGTADRGVPGMALFIGAAADDEHSIGNVIDSDPARALPLN